MPQLRERTLTSGQMGASAVAILAGANAPAIGRVNVIVHNTGTTEQTVLLTFRVSGGTAVRLARAVLEKDQQLIVLGLSIQPDDTLLGQSTSASVVDYLITASDDSAFSVVVLEADGSRKASTSVDLEVTEKFGLTRDGIAITGLLEEMRDLLLKIA